MKGVKILAVKIEKKREEMKEDMFLFLKVLPYQVLFCRTKKSINFTPEKEEKKLFHNECFPVRS